MGRIDGHRRSWSILATPLLSICATTLALLVAVFVGGPIARATFGIPAGFGEHFTSSSSYRQAWIVQGVSTSLAFVLVGIFVGRTLGQTGFRWSMLAANPITVGFGFVLFKLLYESLPLARIAIEYSNIRDGALLALLAPCLFAFCCRSGMTLFLRPHRLTGHRVPE
jgi:hypothetical protein